MNTTIEFLDAVAEVLRISDRKHDAWDAAKAGLALARAEQAEPVGVVQSLHELNDGWLSKLPVGTALYTAAPAKLEPCLTCRSLARAVVLDQTGSA